MSESTLPWMMPCGHEPPQGKSQLHGVCIFCYRDRLAAAEKRAEQVATREALRMAHAVWLWERGHIVNMHDDGCPEDDTCSCLAADHMRVVFNGPGKMPPETRFPVDE